MGFCQADLIEIYEIIGIILKVFKYIIPLIIIIYGILDLYKCIINIDNHPIKKGLTSFFRRIVAGLLIFFLPTIILFLFDITGFNQKDYSCIYNCVLNTNNCSSSGNNNELSNENNLDGNDSDIDYSIFIE